MKRITAFILIVLMAVSILGGCTTTTGTKSTDPTTAATASTDSAAPSKKVEIRFSWWGSELRNEATLKAIEAYQTKNPGVTVVPEYMGYQGYQEKLYALIAAGTAPDIFTSVTEWYPSLISSDAMADMTNAFDMSGHSEAYVNACSYEGKVYGVSTSLNAYGIVYNKALADKYGIKIPEDKYTWDDLSAIWKEVTEKSNGAVCGVMDPRYAGWALEAFGYTYLSRPEPYMYDNEGLTCTAEDVAAFIDYFANLPKGCVLPADVSFTVEPQTAAPVAQGKVLMELESTGTFATMQSQTTDELGLIPYPLGPNGETANYARPGLIQNVYSGSKVKEDVFKFLDWFTNAEDAALILTTVRGVLPTVKQREAVMKVDGLLTRNDMVVIDCINKITASPMHAFLPGPLGLDEARMTTFKNVVSEAVFGKISSKEAGIKYIEEANKVFDSYKK